MLATRSNTLVRYGVAAAATTVALVARLSLQRWLHESSPFTFFIAAVMLAAWYGGLGPGLLATVAGAVLGDCLLKEPPWIFSTETQDLGRMLLFVAVGSQISWLSGAMHSAKRRAQTDAQLARRSERLYRTLASQNQASADGILAVGNNGNIIFINRRLCEIWKVQPEPKQLQQFRDHIYGLLSSHQIDPLSAEKSQLTADQPAGSEELNLTDGRTIERYSAPIIDEDGSVYGRVWFFRDITERKRMQREIIEASERERQRIGQDLHDDLCQQLAGIACLARALQQQLQNKASAQAPQHAEAIGEIVEMINLANQRARDLAKGMQPVNLQQQGLAASLEELCESIQDVFDVDCAMRGEIDGTNVTEAVSIQLYRIAQEAMSNAIRHGKAREIVVDLVAVGERIILTIEDNGTGMSQPLPRTGMGLYIMNYRARLIGGVLSIESGADRRGVIVTCSVPLQAAALEPSSSTRLETVNREILP